MSQYCCVEHGISPQLNKSLVHITANERDNMVRSITKLTVNHSENNNPGVQSQGIRGSQGIQKIQGIQDVLNPTEIWSSANGPSPPRF